MSPLDGLMASLNGQNACLDRQIDHQNDWIEPQNDGQIDLLLGHKIYPVWQNGSLERPDGSSGWPDRPSGQPSGPCGWPDDPLD